MSALPVRQWSVVADWSVFFCADEARAVLAALRREAGWHRSMSGPLGDASTAILLSRVNHFEHQLEAAWLDLAASRLEDLVDRYDHEPTDAA